MNLYQTEIFLNVFSKIKLTFRNWFSEPAITAKLDLSDIIQIYQCTLYNTHTIKNEQNKY